MRQWQEVRSRRIKSLWLQTERFVTNLSPPLRENSHEAITSNILLFNYRVHIYIESARDSFHRLPWNTFNPAEHDINKLQTKDIDEKVGSSTQQVYDYMYTVSFEIWFYGNKNNYSNHEEYLLSLWWDSILYIYCEICVWLGLLISQEAR